VNIVQFNYIRTQVKPIYSTCFKSQNYKYPAAHKRYQKGLDRIKD